MSRYLIDKYQALEAYTPGEQPRDMQYVKLNTNESPYPPAPGVVEAVQAEAGRLQLYSDPVCADLRDALAARYGVKRENVFVSNGSDDILNFAFMAFAGAVPGVLPGHQLRLLPGVRRAARHRGPSDPPAGGFQHRPDGLHGPGRLHRHRQPQRPHRHGAGPRRRSRTSCAPTRTTWC